jgi:HK97 gp10 family phage protein
MGYYKDLNTRGVRRGANIGATTLHKDIARLNDILSGVANNIKKERNKILRKAARPLVAAAQIKAPVSQTEHFRYLKQMGGKAKRGSGKLAAIYMPGNLAGSINIMVFSRSTAIFVGPKISRSGGADVFGPGTGKYDPYYAHMVEFGTSKMAARPFMRPAWISTKTLVTDGVLEGLKKAIEVYAKNYAR